MDKKNAVDFKWIMCPVIRSNFDFHRWRIRQPNNKFYSINVECHLSCSYNNEFHFASRLVVSSDLLEVRSIDIQNILISFFSFHPLKSNGIRRILNAFFFLCASLFWADGRRKNWAVSILLLGTIFVWIWVRVSRKYDSKVVLYSTLNYKQFSNEAKYHGTFQKWS